MMAQYSSISVLRIVKMVKRLTLRIQLENINTI